MKRTEKIRENLKGILFAIIGLLIVGVAISTTYIYSGAEGDYINTTDVNANSLTLSILGCDSVDTDSKGKLICGTDAGGAGSLNLTGGTLTGGLTLDDGSGASPTLKLQNQGDYSIDIYIADAGDAYISTSGEGASSPDLRIDAIGGEIRLLKNTYVTGEIYDDDVALSDKYLAKAGGIMTGNLNMSNKDIITTGNVNATEFYDDGTALSSKYSLIAGSASITTVGTIGSGIWQGSQIADAYISNTLTCSDLAAGSSVVGDSEVDDNITVSNYLLLAGGNLTGTFTFENATVPGGASSLNIGGGNVFGLTGGEGPSITSISGAMPGRVIFLYNLGGADYGFTSGGSLKLAGNYIMTLNDTLTLVSDGTNWYEVARSVN